MAENDPATEQAIAPSGEPLDGSDDALDRRSAVDSSDAVDGVKFWRKHAPEWAKDLIEAEPEPDAEPPPEP